MKLVRLCEQENCKEKAVWGPGAKEMLYYCDEHVPRGCSCNSYFLRDGQGREYPCVDYDYWEHGWNKEGCMIVPWNLKLKNFLASIFHRLSDVFNEIGNWINSF